MDLIKRGLAYSLAGVLIAGIEITLTHPDLLTYYYNYALIGIFVGYGIEFTMRMNVKIKNVRIQNIVRYTSAIVAAVLIPTMINVLFFEGFNAIDWFVQNKLFFAMYIPVIVLVTYLFQTYYSKKYKMYNERLREIQKKVGEQ